ncbi:MAG: ImmA/IrrE family metallo-endopeptidase [Clostridiales bacterium]|nr:ImmA/IrrE family metallo-endopeptidase [Clostridiales bacterium]
MKENKVQKLTKQLEEGIKDLYKSDKYKEYLDVMSRFHNYSSNNIGLILLQKPDASRVAGFNAWKKEFNRFVNKGEKGIGILAPASYKKTIEIDKIDPITQEPMLNKDGKKVTEKKEITQNYFRVVYVFDVSQTDGEPLPELASKLTDEVKDFDVLFNILKNVSPYPIEYEDITSSANGYCDPVNKRIAIRKGLAEAQIIKTAIHEIAHSILHSDLKTRVRDSSTREVEAESIAYVVSNVLGIDTSSYSFGYVGGWSKDKELSQLKSSLDTIQKTSHDLIFKIDGELKLLQMNRENNLKISLYDGEIDLDRVKEEDIEKPSLGDRIEKAKEKAKDVNKNIKLDNKVEIER